MIRILMIVPRFESTGRGVEVFAKYLATGLDPYRFEITILSGPHSSSIDGVRCVQFPIITREKLSRRFNFFLKFLPARLGCKPVDLEALSLVWNARQFLYKKNFDVIMPFGGTWTYRFAHYFKKQAKIISIGHAGPVKTDLALSNIFIALTPEDKENAKKINPHVRSIVIPNGVDLNAFYPPALSRDSQSHKTILCVGAFTEDKRQDLLLDALGFLNPNIKCILAGKGPKKASLQNHPQVRLGRVQFLELPHDQMPDLYRRVDAFTLPAPHEAFGLVFLEALASGLPVVANDGKRQRFVIGETGIYCNVFSPQVYAKAIELALNLPLDEARLAQVNRFTWEGMIKNYEALLDNVNKVSCHEV